MAIVEIKIKTNMRELDQLQVPLIACHRYADTADELALGQNEFG
jgi:hypothetical protein